MGYPKIPTPRRSDHDRWLEVPLQNPEPYWLPPQNGGTWWSCKDPSVGTADYIPDGRKHGDLPHFSMHILLQMKIDRDKIVDARCWCEDAEWPNVETVASFAKEIASFITGKTFAEALTFNDFMSVSSVTIALLNWAAKDGPTRYAQLPLLPRR